MSSSSRSIARNRIRARAAALVVFAFLAMALAMSTGRAASPISVLSARTVDDGDGYLNRITLTFSGPMDATKQPIIASAAGAPGFFVDDYEISSIAWAPADATTLHLDLVQKTTPDTAARPKVRYVNGNGNALDPAGQELASGQWDPRDGAGPALVYAAARDVATIPASPNIFNATGDTLFLHFSEPAFLAGATALDRWTNLERAFKLNPIAPQNSCTEAAGTVQSFNFPQPGTGGDPIDKPARVTDAETVFTISLKANNVQPTHKFPAVPLGCKIGVDANWRQLVTDAAGNLAASQDMPVANAQRVWVQPADIRLLTARTADGRTGAADGIVDAIELTFDQRIEDATVLAQLPNIAVSLAGADAVVDTSQVDTGTEGDNVFFVRLTTPAPWGGAVKPRIAYTKPTSCTGDAGQGIKGPVPTAGYKSCVASFDVEAADGVAPIVLGGTTLDSNGNGALDTVRLQLSEALVTGSTAGWKIDGRDATSFAIGSDDARYADVGFPEGQIGDTGTLPQIRYTRQGSTGTLDNGANEVAATNRPATVDGAAPRIRTATILDANGDGSIDRVDLQYSENIVDPAAAAAGDFRFDGVQATGFIAGTSNDNALSLAFPSVTGTGAKPFTYTAGSSRVKDAVNNQSGNQSLAADVVADAAAPRGVVNITPGAPMSAGTKTVEATFTEPMKTDVTPVASVGSKVVTPVNDENHTNGWRNADPSVWDGTVEIVDADCAVPTGCQTTVSVTGAQDARGNGQGAPASLTTEIDTIAPQAPTITGFAAALQPGESAPANVVNMFTNSVSVTASMVAGDAAAGHAELLVDGAALTPPAKDTTIAAGDTSAVAVTSFASREALQAAIAEGARALSIRLCDDALNCSTSASAHTVTADYTPADVSLSAPTGGNVVAGGSTMTITWDGDDAAGDFDHSELELSTNGGTSYATGIDRAQPRDGSFEWTVPQIDVANAKVRVVSVDVNGNKDVAAVAEAFSIDSTAPVVRVTSPSSAMPFVDGAQVIRWTATDASIGRATDPITIEYSTNNGSTWTPINGGSYSKANDGQETWNVPSEPSALLKVRVRAEDATGKSTTIASARLISGVKGFVADKYGAVYGFGTADKYTSWSRFSGYQHARGIALQSNGKAGYVVSGHGIVYPFTSGGEAMPPKTWSGNLRGDYARGLALWNDTTGYVLHRDGRVFRFGGAPLPKISTWFRGKDMARDIVMLPNKRGGYVLDAYGRLHPFAVGSHPMPPRLSTITLSTARAVSVVLRDNGTSGWVLDNTARLIQFGGAPWRRSVGYGSTANAVEIVLVTQDAGYWVDHRGVLRPWGNTYGNPTLVTLGYGRARASTM